MTYYDLFLENIIHHYFKEKSMFLWDLDHCDICFKRVWYLVSNTKGTTEVKGVQGECNEKGIWAQIGRK